ncbi:MAG: hypothetical protein JXN62_13280 [Bacteroidales bacterium]|nr:hypothetical protein [Bacteroidales bacterium]
MAFTRGKINIGIRELIKEELPAQGFYHGRNNGEFTDIELLRYVSSAGKEEWFDFLIKNGDFFDERGKIRKEFAGQFDECIIFAVNHGHAGIARKLFGMGAKVRYYLNDSLLDAIMRNQYEMAELCFEMGAKIRIKYHFADCLKKADDRMVGIIEKNRESIVLSLIAEKQKCITELIDKRKKRKK